MASAIITREHFYFSSFSVPSCGLSLFLSPASIRDTCFFLLLTQRQRDAVFVSSKPELRRRGCVSSVLPGTTPSVITPSSILWRVGFSGSLFSCYHPLDFLTRPYISLLRFFWALDGSGGKARYRWGILSQPWIKSFFVVFFLLMCLVGRSGAEIGGGGKEALCVLTPAT